MLEIPQLCACGTDHPFKVIQAALISSGLVSVEKCSFIPNLVVLKHCFLVWIGGRMTSVSSLTCTFPTTFLSISCSCCQPSNIDIYLKLKTCKYCANIIISCQCSRKKNYESLCNSLDQKCVDKCTYALITILPISKGNVHTQVHNSTVVFLNCEQEEYSLCIFFSLMSTACLPSLLLLANLDLLHAYGGLFTHTKSSCCVFIECTPLRPSQV